jgi:hypothetical protein
MPTDTSATEGAGGDATLHAQVETAFDTSGASSAMSTTPPSRAGGSGGPTFPPPPPAPPPARFRGTHIPVEQNSTAGQMAVDSLVVWHGSVHNPPAQIIGAGQSVFSQPTSTQ